MVLIIFLMIPFFAPLEEKNPPIEKNHLVYSEGNQTNPEQYLRIRNTYAHDIAINLSDQPLLSKFPSRVK